MTTAITRCLQSSSIIVRVLDARCSGDIRKRINITVESQTNVSTHKTEFIIKLTDETDPFFLYSVFINEEDYQTLKAKQGLNVDFNEFGKVVMVDLLQECEKECELPHPKHFINFTSREPLIANIEIMETNKFKNICHVSLELSPGTDSDVKTYLAGMLNKLREENAKLNALYDTTRKQLSQQLEQTQMCLNENINELNRLREEMRTSSEQMASKHEQEMNFERERAAQTQFSMQQKHEKERREWEASSNKTIKQLEERILDLETHNKELAEKRYKNDTYIQELEYRNKTLQDDLTHAKTELSQFKKENNTLEIRLHESEKQAGLLTNKVSLLEQDVKDKSEHVRKLQESLYNEQNQVRQLDESLKEKTAKLKEKQIEITRYMDEFQKGNDHFAKLKEKEGKLFAQLKLKSKIMEEQEKKLVERDSELERLNGDIQKIKKELGELKEENDKLNTALKQKTAENEAHLQTIKQKDGMINYYNKQLNEKNVHDSLSTKNAYLDGPMLTTTSSTSSSGPTATAASFRPYGNLLSTNNHFINSNLSPSPSAFLQQANTGGANNKLRNSTSPNGLNIVLANELDLTGGQARLGGMPTTNGSGAQNGGGISYGKNPLLSSSASSMQHHHSKENLEINPQILTSRAENLKLGSTSSTTTTGMSAAASSSGKLDPKYFYNPQALIHPPSSLMSNQIDLLKKQPQLTNGGTSNPLGGKSAGLASAPSLNAAATGQNVGMSGKTVKPGLAAAYCPP